MSVNMFKQDTRAPKTSAPKLQLAPELQRPRWWRRWWREIIVGLVFVAALLRVGYALGHALGAW